MSMRSATLCMVLDYNSHNPVLLAVLDRAEWELQSNIIWREHTFPLSSRVLRPAHLSLLSHLMNHPLAMQF